MLQTILWLRLKCRCSIDDAKGCRQVLRADVSQGQGQQAHAAVALASTMQSYTKGLASTVTENQVVLIHC